MQSNYLKQKIQNAYDNIYRLGNCSVEEFLDQYKRMSSFDLSQLFKRQDRFILREGLHVYRIGDPKYGPDIPPIGKQKPSRFVNRTHNVLYTGFDTSVLERECYIKKEDSYHLFEYEVQKDITLGVCSFNVDHRSVPELITNFQKLCQAPFYSNIGVVETELVKESISRQIYDPLLRSFQFGILLSNELYTQTHKIYEMTVRNYPDGLRYASCYAPHETQVGNTLFTLSDNPAENSPFGTTDSLFALSESGVKKLKCIGECDRTKTSDDIDYGQLIKTIMEDNT